MTDTVTITREEYDALIAAREDLEDLRAVEAFKADPREGLPHDLVKRMIDGDSLITLWREHRGFSTAELAELSGVHRTQLHGIESGRRGPSVDTLHKLANALGVTMEDLID